MFLEKKSFGPFQTNSILIACMDTKEAALIDPALGSFPYMNQVLQEYHLILGKILCTHSHLDHFAAAHKFQEKLSPKLYVHPLDEQNLLNPGSDGLGLFLEALPARVDHHLIDLETIYVGHIEITVLFTPGHSPGSVCFYIPKEKILISGDTLFKGAFGNVSFPHSNRKDMQASLKRIMQLPADTIVIPGHGENTTIGQESRG